MPSIKERTLSILAELGRGDRGAASRLFPHVYDELREIARKFFSYQRRDHTLQPTALVHEAYLRLVDKTRASWKDRSHFVAVASRAMRQILVDHFRHGQASKRGGRWQRVTLSGIPAAEAEVDFLALEEALTQLTSLDPRQATVVELRFFGGLTVNEVAEVLRISRTTVEGEWRAARAWLARELRKVELQ